MDVYYPFGLTLNSWQRPASTLNRFKFQGQEHQEETGWYAFKWRNHQSDIGRFFYVDPLAEKYVHNSPYAFAENKIMTFVELEGLEGLHYMETLANGSQRHVIEKSVVVLTQAPQSIPSNSSPRKVDRITNRNVRTERANAAKVKAVANELNFYFNGPEGQAINSVGEGVRFQFNVIGLEVEDPCNPGSLIEQTAIAIEYGLEGAPKFEGGPNQIVPAAVLTSKSTTQSQSNGLFIKVDNTPGATAHEVGHKLMLREQSDEESKPGSGGLMVDPPSFIKPAEVDKIFKDAIPRGN